MLRITEADEMESGTWEGSLHLGLDAAERMFVVEDRQEAWIVRPTGSQSIKWTRNMRETGRAETLSSWIEDMK